MESEKATFKQWVGVGGAVLGAFMAVLDVSITNASLQNIQGALGASLDEGSWIATAYLISEIVVIPLTAWFSDIFSIKRYLLVNAVLFLMFSMLCAMSWNLQSMIIFRALQGLTGGVLIPTAASIIVQTLPVSQRPIGLSLFSLAATFGPSIGPTVGGWLTVNYSWQYIFYLNIIPGIALIAIIAWALDAKPMRLELLKKGDWLGIATLTTMLATLTYFLEEGTRKDWFGSPEIKWSFWTCVISAIIFFWNELTHKNPVIDLRVLKNRNLACACAIALALGMGLYGSVYILPLYLASIQNYDALQIGKVVMWVGLPQLFIVPFAPYLIKRVDQRLLIAYGIGCFALSCYLNSWLTHDTAGDQLRFTQIMRALGQPLIMAPLSTIAYTGIVGRDIGMASGLYNMMRNLGGSIGIGVISTLLSQRYRFHFSRITESISATDLNAQIRLQTLTHSFVSKGAPIDIAQGQALQVVAGTINREANVMAFSDAFLFMALALAVAGLLLFAMKKSKAPSGPIVDH